MKRSRDFLSDFTNPSRDHDHNGAASALFHHKQLNLPFGYRFNPTDEEMLTFLNSFNQETAATSIPTCPIHSILDIYSTTPSHIPRNFEKGNHQSWFFLTLKRFPTNSKEDHHVSSGGFWRKRGKIVKIKNGQQVLGDRRYEDFYSGTNRKNCKKTGWNMVQYYLPAKSKTQYFICKVNYDSTSEADDTEPLQPNPSLTSQAHLPQMSPFRPQQGAQAAVLFDESGRWDLGCTLDSQPYQTGDGQRKGDGTLAQPSLTSQAHLPQMSPFRPQQGAQAAALFDESGRWDLGCTLDSQPYQTGDGQRKGDGTVAQPSLTSQAHLPQILPQMSPFRPQQGAQAAALFDESRRWDLGCTLDSQPYQTGDGQRKGDGILDVDETSQSAYKGKRVYPNYTIIGVPGDGRCLFRSVVHGYYLRSGKLAPDEKMQRELADELRTRVADEFIKRRQEIELVGENDLETYVRRIREPHAWGGEPELFMASHVLLMPITVYVKDDKAGGLLSIAEYGQVYGKDDPIRVIFHGYGHYDALVIHES